MSGRYFITNRFLMKTENGMDFEDTNMCSQDLQFCQVTGENTVKVVTSAKMFEALKKSEEFKEFLLYPHGYNNQPWDDIFPTAQDMQDQLDAADMGHIYVLPIIWPCDNDFGMIKDYWDDQESAEFSGKFLARAIGILMNWQAKNRNDPCMKRMHIMAHSMGARLLMKSLRYFDKHIAQKGVPYMFKNTFLMAADIPNEALAKGKEGEHICSASQNVVCFYANDDMAMPASKIANVKNGVFSRRMGHTGPEYWDDYMRGKVFAVNCDSFNNDYDLKGHTYFKRHPKSGKSSPAFDHMIAYMEKPRDHSRSQDIDL